MTERILVGDLVAEFLQAVGVRTAFGVISVHNIPMLDAIGRRNAIRFVMSRGEAGGGHMADAYARVSDGLGVVFTSTGPGAANVTGALVEARFAGSPVLHLTGQTATPNLDRGQGTVHDVPDQLGMLRSVSKAAYRVRSPESAFGILARAAAEALTPPMGPVSVEIPIDVQRSYVTRPAGLADFRLPLPAPLEADPALLDRLADMVAASKRPVLWTGSGAKRAGEAVGRLLALGLPLVTSWNGRGVVPEDHPMSLGPMNAVPEVVKFYETVDLMLVAGTRLRGHETRDLALPLPAKRAQIDVDPQADGRTYATDLFVAADCRTALSGLADRLEQRGWRPDPALADDVARVRREATDNYLKFLGAYAAFPVDLRAVMPRDALWVRDITLNNSTWGNRIFPVFGPNDSVYPVGAAIGPGMQLGIGAAMAADGRKTVCMCGDGGFFMNLSELWTAVQENAEVVFVVMNDRGYGVIKHIQDAMYDGRQFFGDLMGPELKALAATAGVPYWRVDRADGLGTAVAEALKVAGPTLVEVDMAAIGPYPRYFAPPPFAEKEKKG